MSNNGLHIAVDENRLKAIEENISILIKVAEASSVVNRSLAVGDWIHEEEVYRLTKLGRTTLYKLRKEKVLSSSSIVDGKGRFYRLSEIEELLYARQNKEK